MNIAYRLNIALAISLLSLCCRTAEVSGEFINEARSLVQTTSQLGRLVERINSRVDYQNFGPELVKAKLAADDLFDKHNATAVAGFEEEMNKAITAYLDLFDIMNAKYSHAIDSLPRGSELALRLAGRYPELSEGKSITDVEIDVKEALRVVRRAASRHVRRADELLSSYLERAKR